MNGGGGGNNGTSGNMSTHGIPLDPINMMIKRMYKEHSKVLKNSAFVPDYFSFHRCITSLMDRFDLREFLGGMQAYHDRQRMAQILGVDTQFTFANDFVDGRNGQVKNIFHIFILLIVMDQYLTQCVCVCACDLDI